MSRDAAILLGLFAVGAVGLLLHLALAVRVLRGPRFALWQRGLGLLPPLTPVLGWMSGHRVASVLWVLLAMAYLVLWSYA